MHDLQMPPEDYLNWEEFLEEFECFSMEGIMSIDAIGYMRMSVNYIKVSVDGVQFEFEFCDDTLKNNTNLETYEKLCALLEGVRNDRGVEYAIER